MDFLNVFYVRGPKPNTARERNETRSILLVSTIATEVSFPDFGPQLGEGSVR